MHYFTKTSRAERPKMKSAQFLAFSSALCVCIVRQTSAITSTIITYTAFNFKCFKNRQCHRQHDSGQISFIEQVDCLDKCRKDANCVASSYWTGNTPGTCWLDYSTERVCHADDAGDTWRDRAGFTYCVAVCKKITVQNGKVDYTPSNFVAERMVSTLATISCKEGFNPAGSGTAVCQQNGEWDATLSCA